METIKTYMGHTISLMENWNFKVTGPEFDDHKYSIAFACFEEAKTEIEKRMAASAAIAAKNIRLSAKVIDFNGNLVEITGINRRDGKAKGVEGERFFPNVPWVAEAVARINRLRDEVRSIDEKLSVLTIRRSRGVGYIEPADYAKQIRRLEEDIKLMEDKARDMAAPIAVAESA